MHGTSTVQSSESEKKAQKKMKSSSTSTTNTTQNTDAKSNSIHNRNIPLDTKINYDMIMLQACTTISSVLSDLIMMCDKRATVESKSSLSTSKEETLHKRRRKSDTEVISTTTTTTTTAAVSSPNKVYPSGEEKSHEVGESEEEEEQEKNKEQEESSVRRRKSEHEIRKIVWDNGTYMIRQDIGYLIGSQDPITKKIIDIYKKERGTKEDPYIIIHKNRFPELQRQHPSLNLQHFKPLGGQKGAPLVLKLYTMDFVDFICAYTAAHHHKQIE